MKPAPAGALGALFAVALLGAAAGCARPAADDALRVEMDVSPRPPAVGPARLSLRLFDAGGESVAPSSVEVEATMTHPGMTPSLATARLEPPDRWLAEVELTMSGDWVVLVAARLPDGRLLRASAPLPGVTP